MKCQILLIFQIQNFTIANLKLFLFIKNQKLTCNFSNVVKKGGKKILT